MDSGVARPEYAKGVFDPYASLLPEEVCWIIDRTFAAEVCFLSLWVHRPETSSDGLVQRTVTLSKRIHLPLCS